MIAVYRVSYVTRRDNAGFVYNRSDGGDKVFFVSGYATMQLFCVKDVAASGDNDGRRLKTMS